MGLVEKSADDFWPCKVLDRYLYGHKGFVCGGCFKNIFTGEKIKDVDVFFNSWADFNCAKTYFESAEEYVPYYENENVAAFKNTQMDVAVELCCKIFGSPEEILNQFDFTVTKFAYFRREVEDDDGEDTHIENFVLMHEDFFQHLQMRRLVIDDAIPYPMSTLERMFRYVRYGFGPCKETKIKIAMAINSMQPEQIEVSESLYNGID